MDIIKSLILRSDIPDITYWGKDGIYLLSKRVRLNLSQYYNDDPSEVLFLLEEYMDRDLNIKHRFQLEEVYEYFIEEFRNGKK